MRAREPCVHIRILYLHSNSDSNPHSHKELFVLLLPLQSCALTLDSCFDPNVYESMYAVANTHLPQRRRSSPTYFQRTPFSFLSLSLSLALLLPSFSPFTLWIICLEDFQHFIKTIRKNKFPIFRLHANTFLAVGYSNTALSTPTTTRHG